MPIGDQDHGRVAMPVATMLARTVHQALDLALGEIAPFNCQVYEPGVWLKVIAMLVPREHKVQHSNPIKDLTDEELEASIAMLKEMIAKRDAEATRVIEGVAEPVPALPPPCRERKKTAPSRAGKTS